MHDIVLMFSRFWRIRLHLDTVSILHRKSFSVLCMDNIGHYIIMMSLFVTGSTPPLSKEGLWQNWMSTSGSAQLESTSTSSHHHHHHTCHSENGDHTHSYPDKAACTVSCECHGNHGSGSTHPPGSATSPYRSTCSTDHDHSK